ncbi:MAG: metal ABC transporter permease [bacterium]|nr:metal ABC transporter permease [bacterium]
MKIWMEMMSYPFIQRAVLAGTMVALCAALLGVSLVLKRYSMIGDGLSHVSFGALSVALAAGWAPLMVSIPIVILAAFFLLRLTEKGKTPSDAAIAIVSASSLAFGVTVTSLTTGMTTDINSYMFGSILAMRRQDVRLSVALCAVVLLLFLFCYHKMFAVTFDESFARATGVKTQWYNTLIAVLTAVTIVLGMRMMGAMLISSLIIFPAVTAMRLFKSFKAVVLSSAATAVLCFVAGIMISYQYGTPAGASVVLMNLALFLAATLVRVLRERL